MLSGNTILAGDSITVRLSPFVKVNGSKREIAEGGRPTAWLLQKLAKTAATGGLNGFQNLVVLIGTNDIGGGRPVSDLVRDIRAIWAIGKEHGLRVYAQTIPPVKGYAGFHKNFETVNARRKAINKALGAAFVSGEADGLIDLSTLMADSQDPDRLSKAYDGGDHIHPRKDAHGALLSKAFEGSVPLTPLPHVPPAPSILPLATVLGAGVCYYLLSRKP